MGSRSPLPPPRPEDSAIPEYVNPLEKSSRWTLAARAVAIRSAATLGFTLASYQSPIVPSPTKVIWLDATLGRWKAKKTIRVDVWEPSVNTAVAADARRRPAVINFHGGGFILGQGTDDGRWAAAATAELGAVVFSVNYRLAPEYPFPTAVEDCACAVAQLCSEELAAEHGIDPGRVTLSGFSAGGTLAMACWVALQTPEEWGYEDVLPSPPPSIAGFALYYPLLDWTLGRQRKRDKTARPDLTLPKSLTDLIDASYVYPPLPRSQCDDLRLSPGLMPDDLVRRLPPVHLCLCEHDMLAAEGQTFADRLRAAGRTVEVRVVAGEKHAWDKPPPLAPKQSAMTEYQVAIAAISGWIGRNAANAK